MKKFALIQNDPDYTNIQIFGAESWEEAVEYLREEDAGDFDEMNTLVELNDQGEGNIYISYEVDGPGRVMGGHELEEDEDDK